jgi:transposase InsO family protein
LHADLSFPGAEGFDEFRWLLTVIDAATRFSWCITLKLKSAAADELQCLIVRLEKMFDKEVGMLQSDQGGDFSSTLLTTSFRDRGVVTQMTLTGA